MDILSDKQYCRNLENAVIEIFKNVKPYPPHDIVLPCIMDFDCGFANPIILSNHNSEEIYKLLQNNYLDTQISNPYQSMVETIS